MKKIGSSYGNILTCISSRRWLYGYVILPYKNNTRKKRKRVFFFLNEKWKWGGWTYLGRGVRASLTKEVPHKLRPEETKMEPCTKPGESCSRQRGPDAHLVPHIGSPLWRDRTKPVCRTERKWWPMRLDQSRGREGRGVVAHRT